MLPINAAITGTGNVTFLGVENSTIVLNAVSTYGGSTAIESDVNVKLGIANGLPVTTQLSLRI